MELLVGTSLLAAFIAGGGILQTSLTFFVNLLYYKIKPLYFGLNSG